jgi:hypothetical protein
MAPQAWQVALRRQFGRESSFSLENLGAEAVFSEFRVVNPASGGRYRVAIRGAGLAENYCSCPDFATNELGTCKHIEFALAKLEKRRGGKKALARGYQPPFSELYLRYGAMRSVHFRPGADCPACSTLPRVGCCRASASQSSTTFSPATVMATNCGPTKTRSVS